LARSTGFDLIMGDLKERHHKPCFVIRHSGGIRADATA
jgi:hypothetical protein